MDDCLRHRFFNILALSGLAGLCLALAACAPPATLKQRHGYWADQSIVATAYNQRVRFLVLHYTDGDGPRALKVLTGPQVSAHYLVGRDPNDRDGAPIVRQLVPESARAWHAGVSGWAGRRQINDSSIGIEIVNAGPTATASGRQWPLFTEQQIRAVIALASDIVARYGIFPKNIVAHSDIAPGRKIDPGPAFPWFRLYQAGIGAWPDETRVAFYRQRFFQQIPDILQVQRALAEYGYDLAPTGLLDAATRKTLTAFQMHFRPSNYSGQPDADTLARLWALNERYRRE